MNQKSYGEIGQGVQMVIRALKKIYDRSYIESMVGMKQVILGIYCIS